MSIPSGASIRQLSQRALLQRIRDRLCDETSPDRNAAFTLILGAGGSVPVVPTARQMVEVHIPEWLLKARGERGLPADLRLTDDERKLVAARPVPPALSASPLKEKLLQRARWFWGEFHQDNPDLATAGDAGNGLDLHPATGVPQDIGVAYRSAFDPKCQRGFEDPSSARRFVRSFNPRRGGQTHLNATHFYLASILGLQPPRNPGKSLEGKPYFDGCRPFLQTIFTTNFDPLLQVSLQAVNVLYYMTDRADIRFDPDPEDPAAGTLHLLYVHGSVHRGGLANTGAEIEALRAHKGELVRFLESHAVLVVGYSGWDDCLLDALEACGHFSQNLYWCGLDEQHLVPRVRTLLGRHDNAFFVPITGAGQLFAALHAVLCPGLIQPELIERPLRSLCELLRGINLDGVPAYEPGEGREVVRQPDEAARSAADDRRTPAEWVTDTFTKLEGLDAELFARKTTDQQRADLAALKAEGGGTAGSAVIAQSLLRQADLSYAAADDAAAFVLYNHLVESKALAGADLAEAFSRRGFCHGEAGRLEEAMADYSRAIELSGALPDQVAKALFNRGVCRGQAGRLEEEIADYSRVIELPGVQPDQVASALCNRGVAYKDTGNLAAARADWDKALSLEGKGASEEVLTKARANLAAIKDK